MSNPNDFNFWFQKAMSGGRFIEDIQRSLRLNPHHIDSWIYYAGYYASSVNENDKTVEVVNQLLKYDPKPDASPSLFEYVLKKVQKYTDDDAPLKKVKPDTPYWDNKYEKRYCGEWLIVAAYYWKNQKFNEAYDAFKKAISYPRNKNRALLWYIYLVLNLAGKEYSKAIEYGEKAIELDPGFKYAWQQLGKAYLYGGDHNYATNCNERALKLDKFFEPSLKLKDEIKEKIREIKKFRSKNIFSYQRQHLSKEEVDFLQTLERECEKPIPVINEVNWDDAVPKFGFVTKNGHIIELGLNHEAFSVIKIPESIGSLKYLEVLSITSLHHLQKFPESIIYLNKLKYFRYEHCTMPFNPYQELKQGILPKIIYELQSIEKLHLSGGYLNSFSEKLAFLPNLKEIKLSPTQKLSDLPPVLREYFDFQELQLPTRKYLIRKKKGPKIDEISPDAIYNQYLLKTKSETEAIKDLYNLIEKSGFFKRRIKAIELLKKFPSKSEKEFNMLEGILKKDSSILIKISAINVILRKFFDDAYESLKFVLLNEKAVEVIDYIRHNLQKDDSKISVLLKDEFSNFFTIKDIEKLIGQRLTEITDFSVVKRKYHRREGPHGYIKKGNRITHLGLNLTSPVMQHDITFLPNIIGELKQLEELKLIDCQKLETLPEDIGKLKNLKKLDCTGCTSLEFLPENIGDLENLEILNLSECYSLKILPVTLSKLKKLRVLGLKDCFSLTTLSKDLGGFDSLEVLNLKNCQSLIYIPDTIINLQKLEKINLEGCNNLENLPRDIWKIKPLKTLNLKRLYHLKEIPNSIGNNESQKILDLSYCYFLTELPETLGNLRDLQKLILRGCRELKNLPESLGNLENLEEINLYACRKLRSLPKNIGKLKNLRKLQLSYCESLISLPKSIVNLKNLEYVNIEGCISLNSFPENVAFLEKLRELQKKIPPSSNYRIKSNYDRLDLELKEYQEKRYSELKSAPIILIEKVQDLIKRDVDPEDAKILIRFFRFLEWDLDKSELYEDLDKDQGDMWPLHHYKINENGKVIELHLHHGESIFLTFFPDYLCLLESLEVIRFPNNLIETIPECITDLKSLRTLELSNVEHPNPAIPDSVKSFIKSLENYNTF